MKSHGIKWEEYKPCFAKEKKAFFDTRKELYVNTLPTHFESWKEQLTCQFDANIIDDLVGGMLFDLNDDLDDCLGKDKALSMFKNSTHNNGRYT